MRGLSWGGRVVGKLLVHRFRASHLTHGGGRVVLEFAGGSHGLTQGTLWGCQLRQAHVSAGVGDGDEGSGLSKHFEEDRVFGYAQEQVYDVVAGVDMYEEFVPWCQKSKVLSRDDNRMTAELEIGFKMFVERYISHVELKPPSLITSSVSESALFHFLNNEWHFKPGPTPDSCNLHFVVDFQFKSPLYRKVAHLFFEEVQSRLVGSFEDRCKIVFGPSVATISSYLCILSVDSNVIYEYGNTLIKEPNFFY